MRDRDLNREEKETSMTTGTTGQPEWTEAHLKYLDEVFEYGEDMSDAAELLREEFAMGRKRAKIILAHWMKTFSERHSGSDSQATDEHLEYLDALRESGVTNMFDAVPYLMKKFGLPSEEASRILAHWMKTFSERHPGDASQPINL
jgi:hypothetical protein